MNFRGDDCFPLNKPTASI